MRIAITGTPGCGKSSLSNSLNLEFNFIEVEEIAKKYECFTPSTNENESAIVDVEELVKKLLIEWSQPPKESTIITGHLSHLLPVDAIIILRCNPLKLKLRLENRNWNQDKINSNVECELLGGPWEDLIGCEMPPCLELDNTSADLDNLSTQIIGWIAEGTPSNEGTPPIDWIAKLHE